MPYSDPNPYKDKARIALRNAVKRGEMIKPKCCSNCGIDGLIHAHHEDYDFPLKVVWLCPQCHKERHNWINDIILVKATSVAKELI